MDVRGFPVAEGLYDPRNEHDACGVGFVVHIKGKKSHEIVSQGIELLVNLEHRGAAGAEANSGDGAGILTQVPHKFFARKASEAGFKLPEPGEYGVGQVCLPSVAQGQAAVVALFEKCAAECGQEIIGWRDVPTDNSELGESVKSVEPVYRQVFFRRGKDAADSTAFERKLYVVRKYAERTIRECGLPNADLFYVGSLSSKTLVYKGLFTSTQVLGYFADLTDPDFESALALVHSRFSTNTFPTWPLAHPFRYIAHNGEINTLRGNENWMRARESLLSSEYFTDAEIQKLLPIIDPRGSDSAKLDNVVELLMMGGRSLPHVMMMLIPEAWEKDPDMAAEKRAFYEYHGTIMEPWDGPASVAFTDGEIIGATLDRNGLRPSRYQLTTDDILVMASEAGVLRFAPEKIVLKGRLQPGKMFVVSLAEGRIIPDDELKHTMATRQPYGEWLKKGKIDVANLTPPREIKQPAPETVLRRQKLFGYTLEDLKILMSPMVNAGEEALGSMGNDAALAVLSDKSRNLFDYFHQLFAQVTNPPIDKDREEMVMSLTTFVGKEDNLLSETEVHCRTIELPHPVLTNDELERLRWVDKNHFQAKTIPIVFKATAGENRLEKALERIRRYASEAVNEGYNVLILSDKPVDSDHAAIPSLLAVSAVHHHLIREGLRARCGLLIETGEAREIHHFALLLGYGASAINPYLAFETIEDMRRRKLFKDGLTLEKAEQHYVKAVNKGLLKVISKMGISTIQSYIGAQIFEAVGVGASVVDEYFTGTASRIGGIDLATIEEETLLRHRFAYPEHEEDPQDIESGGQYQWRQRGERHMLTPDVVHKLQHAVRTRNFKTYQEYTRLIDEQGDAPLTLRGLLDFAETTPVPLEEVEPAEGILKRFASGAMSFGSISWEAHTTLAMAMNRIGARSNTGEGGEDPLRFKPLPNGDSMRSSIKQVASGRFGVTSEYLVNADELQIKMAQGAKPGEGGQLPGWKVDKFIAKTRHSTAGVGLISPPPHHDIYSIEDLAQLIYDLKNSNDRARISVKLVAEVGVGTVAAGVAKAHSDVILIAGYDGGTGASPLTSIKHAGLPWELGLSEAHQVLIKNGLRDRVVLQTDGMLRTGRDIAMAALLGAEEWGVATGGLVAMGCIMMRKCHLNTCPVGIATQDPELRRLFPGEVEHVVNFYKFLAEDLRQHMARLGFRTVDEMVGRVDKLKARAGVKHWKAKHLELDKILHGFGEAKIGSMHCCNVQDHGLEKALDWELMKAAKPALESGSPVKANFEIRNVHRTAGTILSSNVTRKYGAAGLPEDTIHLKFTGSAGQSFGAFSVPGVTLEIEGEANDYVGKGLSGGKIIIYPPAVSTFVPADNVIVGNVCFYGATSGEAYIRGKAGERFCVRNSGAEVVAESCGDHGCEYMTGGRLVLLGSIGRNFGAGMSGGIAYLYDPEGKVAANINREMVDLDEVTEAEEVIELRGRIERHLEYTGSAAAKEILANWKASLSRFVKVMPRDYKRAMAELRAEALVKGRSEMGKVTGFKEFDRKVPSYLPPEERTKNYQEFVVQLPVEEVQTQGARCMDCGIPFCHTGCPLGNIIPDFNDHVYNGKWEAALKSLLSTNNFPEFTGRICPAPCESACVLGINKPPVTIKNIEVSIIDYAYAQGFIKPNPPPFRTGKKVAVVGSGPAGLAAADQLNKAGHLVTVFERSDRIGGLMRYGIPDFKLSKQVVQRRVDLMAAEGITFRTSAEVGVNVPVEELRKDFDAIVLAGGSTLARDLPITGRDAKGVYLAMDFLRQNNKRVAGDTFSKEEEILSTGKNVVVIGGGDTGSDCVGTSIRHGAKSVTQIELLPKPPGGRTLETPWPTHPGPRMLSTSSSQAEGCERDWSVLSKEFLKDAEGNLTGIRAVRLQWDGPKFTEIEGSEFIMPAERVYLAMGFMHPEHKGMLEQLGVEKDERGNVKAGPDYETSVEGIFSAGDMRRGQSLVVWAISEGRECARHVDEFLLGHASRLESKNHIMAEASV